MSEILANITSLSSGGSDTGFIEVEDLVDTVDVPAGGVVLLVAVVPLDQAGSNDEAADFRFAVDDVLEGPEVTAFREGTDLGCGVAISLAIEGLSGSTKFALQWRERQSTPILSTSRVRSFQVIHISDASLLVDITSVSADDAVSGYTDIDQMIDTQTPAGVGSILLMLANMNGAIDTGDHVAAFQFTVGGTGVGPESMAFEDATDEGCGMSHIWVLEGESGATDFALQWDEIEASFISDTGRVRSFQIIEITANAEILSAITSLASDTLTGSYTDVVDLVDTVDVEGTESILLFAAMVPLNPTSDATAAFRLFEDDDGEGPEQFVFSDSGGGDEACGHSVYWAATGKSAGSHTFSLRGQNVFSTVGISTEHRRSFTILELKGAAAQVDKEATDDLDLAIDPEVADVTALLNRQEAIDLALEETSRVVAALDAFDSLDLVIDEATGQLAVMVNAADDLDLALTELAQLLALIGAADTIELVIGDAASSLNLIARSDTLSITIDDAGVVAVQVTAADQLDLAIGDEVDDLCVALVASDTLALAIAEASQVLAFLERADTLNLALVEGVPVLLARASAEDTLDLAIVDQATVQVPIEASDLVGLAIAEVSRLLGSLEANDILSLSVDEITTLAGFLNRSDIAGLELGEDAGLLAFLDRIDTLDLDIDDVSNVLNALTVADGLGLSIGDVAAVLSAFTAIDSLGLAIDEAPAGLVKQTAFQGIIVQPFTLVVCREAAFTLETVREVNFTLQIEGSGEQIP